MNVRLEMQFEQPSKQTLTDVRAVAVRLSDDPESVTVCADEEQEVACRRSIDQNGPMPGRGRIVDGRLNAYFVTFSVDRRHPLLDHEFVPAVHGLALEFRALVRHARVGVPIDWIG